MSQVPANALADALARLHGSEDPLPASRFTAAQQRALREYAQRTGAVRQLPRGRGLVYEVRRPDAVALKLRELRPGVFEPADDSLPARARNIAHSRNSKAGPHAHEHAYLLLKAISPQVTWHSEAKGTLDLAALCRTTGAAALEIHANDDWLTPEPIWLVENQALFQRTDWLPTGSTGSVIYYSGNLTRLQRSWLASRARAPEILYFPDYDGVGLLNFALLAEVSAAPVRFWCMPGWRDLLRRLGSGDVWRSTQQAFDAACKRLEQNPRILTPELADLILELKTAGLALEHEAVWLQSQPHPSH